MQEEASHQAFCGIRANPLFYEFEYSKDRFSTKPMIDLELELSFMKLLIICVKQKNKIIRKGTSLLTDVAHCLPGVSFFGCRHR